MKARSRIDLHLHSTASDGSLPPEEVVALAETAGVPEDFWGFYAQGSWAWMPESLRRAAPHIFGGEGAAFTLVFRYDWVDLDGDLGEAFEPGINFRPVADTVLKFSYRFGTRGLGLRGVWITMIVDWAVRTAVLAAAFRGGRWKSIRL